MSSSHSRIASSHASTPAQSALAAHPAVELEMRRTQEPTCVSVGVLVRGGFVVAVPALPDLLAAQPTRPGGAGRAFVFQGGPAGWVDDDGLPGVQVGAAKVTGRAHTPCSVARSLTTSTDRGIASRAAGSRSV
jgi:hypothetical protein